MSATELGLKRFGYFADLSEDELAQLEDGLDVTRLREGAQIVMHGQESDGMLLLIEGDVQLEAADGSAVGSLAAPECIGAAALVAVGAREATVRSEGPAVVALLSRTAFHRFADDAPRAAVRVLEAIAADLATSVRNALPLVD